MIEPRTISEQMLFNTIRIECENGSTGTGFFFVFNLQNQSIPIIITNKHVVNGNKNEKVKFSLHTSINNKPSDEKIDIEFNTEWQFHNGHDLCFCFAGPLINEVKMVKNKDIFFIPITEDVILSNERLTDLSAIEDVVMVGYPNGLWDILNNLPLFRTGITSSHPALSFNRDNVGVVDMACFPGSSGSPIFILNENSYSDKNGNINLGTSRLIFLGILFEGPTYSTKGKLIVDNILNQQIISPVTPAMINLGYYIKAVEILSFKQQIIDIINDSKDHLS